MANAPASVYLRLADPNVSLDPARIDSAIVSHGVWMVHYRGMRCPVGLVDPDDQRRPHPDHSGCSNGYLFTRAGSMKVLFIGNSKEKRKADFGFLDAGVATATMPRSYADVAETVRLAPGDRLYLQDEAVIVLQSETVKASGAGSDRLSRAVVSVQDLIDSSGVRLVEGQDFKVADGRIVWTGRRPSPNPVDGQPAVFAVRYFFRPTWYVSHLLHELRNGQQSPDGSTILLNQQAMLQREYLWQGTQQNDPQAKGGEPGRQAQAPDQGSLGPKV